MTDVTEPLLLEKFLIFGDVGSLDVSIKAALRLCSKKIKAIIDATPVAGKMRLQDLFTLVQNSSKLTFSTLKIIPGSATPLQTNSLNNYLPSSSSLSC